MSERTYRNLFLECGYKGEEIEKRVNETFEEIFYGENRFYGTNEDGSVGYLEDTGNHDARTEGMSYGMMMCVQLDRKKEFDSIWNFAKTYMFMEEGRNAGYFAWSVQTNGEKNAYGPAPDGEEFFAMALFFASHRWGDGEGIYNYSKEARELLHTVIHKGESGDPSDGKPMWNPENHQIKFITECDFTDPSYHLPHFYSLFAKWADEEDREFWKEAAKCSRDFLMTALHPETGLNAEYSYYDGSPCPLHQEYGRHDWFYSDAYRTIANIGLDSVWYPFDDAYGAWRKDIADKHQKFFYDKTEEERNKIYEVDGRMLDQDVLHPIGLLATIAQASLATDSEISREWVKKFWDTPLRVGERRYYDNCLYLFAMLALSGNYRIW